MLCYLWSPVSINEHLEFLYQGIIWVDKLGGDLEDSSFSDATLQLKDKHKTVNISSPKKWRNILFIENRYLLKESWIVKIVNTSKLTFSPTPQFRVDADKGFNYSNADESFVCQKKNHFQVTIHVQPIAEARYVRTSEGTTHQIESFALHFHGVKVRFRV